MKYVLIIPARNEEPFIDGTLASVCAQTLLPERWVQVNDDFHGLAGQNRRRLNLARSVDCGWCAAARRAPTNAFATGRKTRMQESLSLERFFRRLPNCLANTRRPDLNHE